MSSVDDLVTLLDIYRVIMDLIELEILSMERNLIELGFSFVQIVTNS